MKTSRAAFTFLNKSTYNTALSTLKECEPIVMVEGKEYKNLHKFVIILSDIEGDGNFALQYGKDILSTLGLADSKDSFNYHYTSNLQILENGRVIWG